MGLFAEMEKIPFAFLSGQEFVELSHFAALDKMRVQKICQEKEQPSFERRVARKITKPLIQRI